MRLFNKSVVSLAMAAGLFFFGTGVSFAASIVAVGLDTTTQADWRTTTTPPKTLDFNNDNIYGSTGYFAFSTGNHGNSGVSQPFQPPYDLNGLPAWLTVTANGANGDFSGGYAVFDNPTLTPGPSVTDTNTGFAYNNSAGANTNANLFNLNFGTGTPTDTIRIGIIVNNGVAATITSFTLTSGATPVTQLVGAQTNYPFYVFFDVTGAVASDVITLSGKRATAGNLGISGITLDVPEPASMSLLAVGSLVLIRRRRR